MLLLSLLPLAVQAPPPAATKKIVLDTDPRPDDATALILALNSSEIDVRAITVGPGNASAAQGVSPDAHVAQEVDAERFLRTVVLRIQGK